MVRRVLLLFLFAGSQYAAAIHVRATNTSIKSNGIKKWLVTHIVPATWFTAASHCQREGGVLASPTTRDVAKAMFRAMTIDAKLSSGGVFIGVSNMYTDGHFVSLDGAPFADIVMEWAAGEPNNAGDAEKCVALTGKNELADVCCFNLLPFFCLMQSDQAPSPPLKLCKGKEGYQLEPRTGSCYKFHPAAKPWSQARKTCEAEGTYPVIVNSKIEATILAQMLTKNQHKITGASFKDISLCGFVFVGDKWQTIYGQTLKEAGFDGWDERAPFRHENWDCGAMTAGGRLTNVACDRDLFPYICEMDP